MQLISPRTHGFFDYPTAVLFALAPWVFNLGFGAVGLATLVGGVLLLLAMFTAYPAGMGKAIPFRVHRWIDMGLGAVMIASPWLLGFSSNIASRNFWLIMGAWVGVFALLTSPSVKNATPKRSLHPRNA
jgi:hypothetical protein